MGGARTNGGDSFDSRLAEARQDAQQEARLAKGALCAAVGVLTLSLGIAVGAMLLWGAS